MILRWTVLLAMVAVAVAVATSRDHLPRSGSSGGRTSWGGTGAVRHLQRGSGGDTWRHNARRQQQKLKKPLAQRERKPNIILIITDDQDVELGSLDYMPKAHRILREGGVHFPNAFVTTPMCCPSRSSVLTGMYVHNHNVFTNNDNCSSPYWQQTHEPRSFATYLNNAGYRTGYFGKYLNEYNGTYIPPGWREWAGLIRNSRFYNYTINLNGKKIKHGDDYQRDYYPDLITNDSLTFLRQSKQYFGNKPVMMVLSYPSPHGPEDAAPQYQHLFLNNTSHRTPNWNYAPNPDKQWILKHTGKMEPIHIKFTDMLHSKRLQTLQSVDDAVERIYNELKRLNELENTYIMFVSDHGYHLGQFGLVKGKAMPFEFDVKVPFLIRGPKVPRGVRIPNIVLNLDIAPTLLDIAGVDIPDHMDGKSVLKILIEANELQMSGRRLSESDLRRRKSWRDTFLIESSGRRSTGERRNFFLMSAMNQSHLTAQEPGFKDSAMTKDQRLSIVCQQPEYKSPCQPTQKWECSHDGYRWRIHKCRMPDVHRRRHKNNCVCPEDNIPKTQLDPAEKDAQRAFLRDHVKKEFKPRFIGSRQQRSLLHADDEITDGDDDDEDDEDEDHLQEEFDNQEVFQLYDLLQLQATEDETTEVPQTLDESEDVEDHEDISDDELYNLNISALATTMATFYRMPLDTTEPSNVDHRITERSPKKIVYMKSVDCLLVNGSSVNCSDSIYQDPRQWRESKDIIDDEIKQLKSRLEHLKGIRKHLKGKRPSDPPSKLTPTIPTPSDQEPEEHAEGDESDSDEGEAPEQPTDPPCSCAAPFGKSNHRNRHRDFALRDERRRIKEERLRNKERKNKKKAKYINTTCNAEKMNCFTHDNNHWKTPPLWTYGPFCFCQNANNNTYWCLRTINDTHNFLFCEFVTGFLSYYDMRKDPYQMQNIIHDIPLEILNQLHLQLMKLKECQGAKECTVRSRTAQHDRATPSFDADTYNSDVAAAQLSKHSTRHWKQGQRWSSSHKRRQNG